MAEDKLLSIPVDKLGSVSALLRVPASAKACYVLAHGAGAGMTHPFMQSVAQGLAARAVATLRYQFPFMERGSKRPDTPAVAHAAVRAACRAAHESTGLRLFAGGKSFGGRMSSQAQAIEALPDVAGLVFLGFPLHPAGKPSSERARHLKDVGVPMLFIQGTRDQLAEYPRMSKLVSELGAGSSLLTIEHADHGFEVLVRSGRTHDDVLAELLDGMASWMTGIATPRR
jgi:predicted alpha/beta-hydrolase family hydrolase